MKNVNNPITGVFIFSKEIKNNGKIVSEGTRPITHIQTDKYSGNGIVKSRLTFVKDKWYQKSWGQIFIG